MGWFKSWEQKWLDKRAEKEAQRELLKKQIESDRRKRIEKSNAEMTSSKKFCPINDNHCTEFCIHFKEGEFVTETVGSELPHTYTYFEPSRCKLWRK